MSFDVTHWGESGFLFFVDFKFVNIFKETPKMQIL